MSDLLCCPFCGSSKIEEDWGAVAEGSENSQYGEISCSTCDASIGMELRGEQVDWTGNKSGSYRLREKWNRRAKAVC